MARRTERRALHETVGSRVEPFIIPMDERHVDDAKALWKRRFGGTEEHTDNWLSDALIENDKPTQGFVAIDGGKLVGFGIVTLGDPEYVEKYVHLDIDVDPWPCTGVFHIVVVHEDYESRGIGSELVTSRLRWLWTTDAEGVIGIAWHRDDNVDSRALFEKFGFEAVETVEEYYAKLDGPCPCPDCEGDCRCDATIYRRPLDRFSKGGDVGGE